MFDHSLFDEKLKLTELQLSVSVVIPYYRDQSTLGNALGSVLRQTMLPNEIIIIDDFSNDGSLNYLQGLKKLIPYQVGFLLVSLEKNQGPSNARNIGWDKSNSDYVAFLDADDSWHPQKLELQTLFMALNPQFEVTGNLIYVLDVGSPWPAINLPHLVSREFNFKDFLWRNRLATSTLMVKRSLEIRFPEGGRFMEDHRFLLQVALQNFRLCRIEIALASHHKASFGAGGLSGNLWKMHYAELANYIELCNLGHIRKTSLFMYLSWSFAKYLRRLLIVAARNLRFLHKR